MHLDHFLQQALLLLACAVVVLVACSRLRIPSLSGLLVTGMLIGPSGLGWVKEVELVELFAEIGVVLLLFVIGLELSMSQLQRLRRIFFVGGSLQAALTLAAAAAGALALGLEIRPAVFFGMVVVLSSTAIVLKLYDQRRESQTPHGRVVLAILLFQDFLVVPILVLTPVLAGTAEAGAAGLALRLGGSLAAAVAVFLVARRLTPRLLRTLVGTGMREVFVLGALGLCLGLAWLTHSLGFSLALGAFLGGILVSETDYSHQMVADVAPFRDVLASLFFVSVGMLVDLGQVWEHLGAVLLLAAAIVAVKAIMATVAVVSLRLPLRTSVVAALSLAQLGEFGFVVMELGRDGELLTESGFQLLLSAAVLTMLVTPLLIASAPALADRLPGRKGAPRPDLAVAGKRQHVVLVGYGNAGQLLARVLGKTRIPYVAVELDGELARRARQRGEPVVFGDASRPEILQHAGIEQAKLAVFAISDPQALRRGVRLARQLQPGLEILVRARDRVEIEGLRALGADHVVAEEFETAIELFTRVLERFHVPRHVVRAQTRVLREESYRMLRTASSSEGVSAAVLDALAAGTSDLFRAEPGSAAVGRTLRDLDLRNQCGALVIALVRGETPFPNPSAEMTIEVGDTLVLVGSHAEIDRAFSLLGEEDLPAEQASEGAP